MKNCDLPSKDTSITRGGCDLEFEIQIFASSISFDHLSYSISSGVGSLLFSCISKPKPISTAEAETAKSVTAEAEAEASNEGQEIDNII